MIRFIFPLFITLFVCSGVHSQLSPENYWQLKSELAGLINKLRAEKQLKPLAFDYTLEQAAVMHSEFMALNHVLQHQEVEPKKLTPKARVYFCGGTDFEFVGENISQSAPQVFPLHKEAISALAKDFFERWRKSPVHYANMINTNYELGDLAFSVDVSNNVIYATHVLGRRGMVIPNQLSKNGFGLRMADPKCIDKFEGYLNLAYNLGNGLSIHGQEVWLEVSDRTIMNTIFSNPKDGLAIDLIDRDQIKCGKENRLDMSPVYDGVLLRPLYTDELKKANRAESDYRYVAKVGDIPVEMQRKNVEPSLLLIKDGEVCMYVFEVSQEIDQYKLVEAKPKILEPENRVLEPRGIVKSVTLNYDFAPRDSVPKFYPDLSSIGKKVHSVYIQSYSSVDGDSLSNAYYHYMRALKIKAHLQSKLTLEESVVQMDYQENWELMDYQMRYYLLDDLVGMKRKDIRVKYKEYVDIPWQKLFSKQRRSCATINFEADLPANAPLSMLAETNLRTALITKNWELANKALAVLYTQQQVPPFLFEIPFYDILKDTPELTQNVAALFTLLPNPDSQEINLFLMACLKRTASLSNDARENLLILYSLISFEKLKIWDLPAQQLSRILEPQKVLTMTQNRNFSPEAMVNMHLTFINYFGQVNDSKNISKSFNYITDYFSKKVLTMKDNARLARFYNNWSMYKLTIDRLKPLFLEKKLDKDGIFILAKVCVLYKSGADAAFTFDVIKAASAYPKEFCAWLNSSFQMQRDVEIKKLYCKVCRN